MCPATADMLSRAPAGNSTSDDLLLQNEVTAYVHAVMQSLPATEMQLKRIAQHQKEDTVCRYLLEYCQSGWPQKQQLPAPISPYYWVSAEITIANDLLMWGNRIIIPESLQQEMLEKVHEGHLGITKCRERARQSIWWPGMSRRLAETVKCCPKCYKMQTQRGPTNDCISFTRFSLAKGWNRFVSVERQNIPVDRGFLLTIHRGSTT